jgi:uncharacterized membrane protein
LEALANLTRLDGKIVTLIAILLVIGGAFAILAGLSSDQQKELLWFIQDYLPIAMFLTLALLLFSGYPVAFVLGGLALLYSLIGYSLGVFSLIEFFNFLPRIWGIRRRRTSCSSPSPRSSSWAS